MARSTCTLEGLIHLVVLRVHTDEATFDLYSVDRRLLVILLLVNVVWSVAMSSSRVLLIIIVLSRIVAIWVVSLMNA